MCGLAGFIDFRRSTTVEDLQRMVTTLSHRGPDDEGVVVYNLQNCQVGLAHRRLSIIDLSEAGRQPMELDRYSIVFNGEIYNHHEIRGSLTECGHRFKGNSDTEVILHAYLEWGDEAIQKFIGMFSIVIFDRIENVIRAFVDRAGVKPFYYYTTSDLILFGSELKVFYAHSRFSKVICKRAVSSYFENVHHGYVPAPNTIFKNTYKLEQGTCLKIHCSTGKYEVTRYWSVTDCYHLPKLKIDYEEAKERLSCILQSAFNYRMISDVPVGVFLSGGYDSASVVALLQRERTQPLKTFTIGFEEGNNEAPYAKDIARFLGTDHYEYICTAREGQEIIPTLPHYFDEPFADSSAIPTILVSKLAKKSVSVALSADAGDEIFAGYQSYAALLQNIQRVSMVPKYLKPMASKLLRSFHGFLAEGNNAIKHKLLHFGIALDKQGLDQAYYLFRGMNRLPSSLCTQLLSFSPDSGVELQIDVSDLKHPLETALITDYQMYLQNDILTKVDRATMSVSLEGREPFLDHRIVEFAAQLPMEFKMNNTSGKRILRDILHQHIPRSLMDRPKIGFSVPVYSWLRSDLSYLIEEHLSDREIAHSGIFNVAFVSNQVKLFKEGRLHYKPLIWKLLMFQMWYKKWMS